MSQKDDKKIKTVKDLISESKAKKSSSTGPKLAEEKTMAKFSKKIERIRIKELEEATKLQAQKLGYNYINLENFGINGDTINSIPQETAEKEKVVCFYKSDSEVNIGSPNPQNPELKKILNKLVKDTYTGRGTIYMISEHSFQHALELYERFPPTPEFVPGVAITGQELEKLKKELKNFGILNAKLNEQKNISTIIKMILAGAMEINASDIHIEPEQDKLNIRYRIDGILHVVATLPKDIFPKIDSRIKNIAGLKINIKDKPQDGRITVFLAKDDQLEIRVSVLPTSYGESIVMRLLKSSVTSLNFDKLGLKGKSYKDLKEQVERPLGMIVTTGPTGSGKTTTLYAILNKLNTPKTKIITLEDPIEYKLEGVSQSQIDHSAGYSFADGLRSILRQDPDIIMVGELRDLETAEVSVQAALTGHKVVSTLHTNDAAGAIPRFLSMGVKPFLLAPALNAVIGQRLVRRIHEDCKIEYKPTAEELAKVKDILADLPKNSGNEIDLNKLKFYRGQGCDKCNHIGYKGRIGIYEIFIINKEIEKEILSGQATEYKITEIARQNGMTTMVQDGLLKAAEGITSIEEVFRVSE